MTDRVFMQDFARTDPRSVAAGLRGCGDGRALMYSYILARHGGCLRYEDLCYGLVRREMVRLEQGLRALKDALRGFGTALKYGLPVTLGMLLAAAVVELVCRFGF